MYEFITIGGGQFFVDFFNGIASLIKSEDYLDTFKIVGTIAFAWAVFQAAFTGDLASTGKWFVTAYLIMNVILIPKATLHITDKTNPALQGATVDNVPFVLAYVASSSSQIGYSLTKQFETVYSTPDDLKYQKNGMAFGVDLMETMTSATIYNARFSESMDSFVKNCIFYDLLLDSYSFDDLKSSNDIWELISPLQSENRFFTYTSDGNAAEYPSCKDGVAKLESDWSKELGEWSKPESKLVNFFSSANIFGKNKVDLKKHIITSLSSSSDIVSDYLLGISMTSSQMLKQAMTNNAIIAATENYEAEYNQQLYQNTRAMMQARNTYQTIGTQAGHWLPIIKILIESIFYAAFPIVVLLAIIPNMTITVLKLYFGTFFWLASWGPLYAILNRFITGYASDKMMDGAGLTLLNHQNIQIINGDISAMAGYMAMFIPLIATGLARGGVAAMSSMSTSFMAVAQGAATQAATEGTTGNLSFGNVGMNARQISSGISIQNDSGMLTNYHKDGSNSMFRGSSESDVGYNISASDRMENMASQSIANETALAQSKGMQSRQLEGKAFESILQNHRSIENSSEFSSGLTSEEKTAFNKVSTAVTSFANENNITQSKSAEIFSNLAIGNKGGNGVGFNGSISSQDQELYQKAQRYNQENNLSEDFSVVKNAAQSNHLNFTDSKGQSINEMFNQSAELAREQSLHLENAQRYSDQKQFIESNQAGIDKSFNQEFYNFFKDKYAGGDINRAAEMFDPNNSGRHEFLDKAASEFIQTKFDRFGFDQNFRQDFIAQENQFLNQNGPKNLLTNEAPKFQEEFRSVDNSGLENSVVNSQNSTRDMISSQTIDQSAKFQVMEKQDKGVVHNLMDKSIDTIKETGSDIYETLDKHKPKN